MTLHFAYGSNMSRAQMGARCPGACALGTATLLHWRFIIGLQGHGSIVPQPGGVVHGVLWRLGARDMAAINAYEAVDTGLYIRRIVPVRYAAVLRPALVYILRRPGEGTPRPAYIGLVVAAARDWGLPERYIHALQRWSPSGWRGTRAKDTGEIR
ncbi:MAG TPA: gamma-glutamylcyclotransferase family protein [Xanthobacteraceae bacterium]|jgi:cation transport regulator ChaC